MCFLKCFGFDKSTTIDGNESVKKTLDDGTVVVMFVSCMAFACCADNVSSAEIRPSLKLPASRSTSKVNTSDIANDVKTMKSMLESIQMATEANTTAINEMKKLSSKTEENVQKLTDQNESNQMSFNATPTGPPAMSYVQAFRTRMLATAGASPNRIDRVNTLKRPRIESPKHRTSKFPEPKVGKKTNANGLSVVPKPINSRENKPKFEKALWVSRLNPHTTNDDVIAYITSNTSVIDKERMSVHKLVKKDVDLTTLKFVSFKIEMNADDLEILNDSDLWPENVQVREFMQTPKNILGNFFPPLNGENGQTKPNEQTAGTSVSASAAAPATAPAGPTKTHLTDLMEM